MEIVRLICIFCHHFVITFCVLYLFLFLSLFLFVLSSFISFLEFPLSMPDCLCMKSLVGRMIPDEIKESCMLQKNRSSAVCVCVFFSPPPFPSSSTLRLLEKSQTLDWFHLLGKKRPNI